MKLLSFFKNLFGKKEEAITIAEAPVKHVEVAKVETPKVEKAKVEEPTKVIENRLAEVAEKKEEKKVTAKDIKSKAKTEVKTEKPVAKAKPVTKAKPAAKAKPSEKK
jgi:histone H1/5